MKIGMWIDHRRAFVVSLDKDSQRTVRIDSDVESKFRPFHLSGVALSSASTSPRQISSERKADARRKHQLHQYYQKVIDQIKDAESIFVFGPGKAKEELQKELRKTGNLHFRIAAVEAADSMTENQVAARVREFFRSWRPN